MNYRTASLTFAAQHSIYAGSRRRSEPIGLDRSGLRTEGGQHKETAMKKFSLARFLRARRVYWNVLQELTNYSDRELHDIGIDRADIHEIARLASQEQG
jgi:uncharacterized protein YjiS (DUF1127 family)